MKRARINYVDYKITYRDLFKEELSPPGHNAQCDHD